MSHPPQKVNYFSEKIRLITYFFCLRYLQDVFSQMVVKDSVRMSCFWDK
jgi:hypothetical protein